MSSPGLCLVFTLPPKADLDVYLTKLDLCHTLLLPSKLICSSTLSTPLPTPPTHHCCLLHPSNGPVLATAEHAFVCMDSHRTPLQPPYQCLFKVVHHCGHHTAINKDHLNLALVSPDDPAISFPDPSTSPAWPTPLLRSCPSVSMPHSLLPG